MSPSSLTRPILEYFLDLPALLKVLVVLIGWALLWLPIAVPLAIRLRWQPQKPIAPSQKLPLLLSLYLIAPLLLWGIAASEGKTFEVYGLPWATATLISLGKGTILGALGIITMFAVQTAFGWVQWRFAALSEQTALIEPTVVPPQPQFQAQSAIATLAVMLLLGLWVSLVEELVFRGFMMNELQPEYAPWLAAAIASLIFALLHLIWEGRDNLSQLPGLWLMGMVLVLAQWIEGGNLGLAWGLHAGWIWIMASLDATQAITYPGQQPEWVTGPEGKPLAGVAGILFLLITAVVLWGLQ